ncbi:cytochrome c biogenesis protein CcsA [Kiritimatiellota bacterium B12222]|nr:cytochrome c biogenesis protein CcsA [Kiritimatiellota bacterium B12222]
MKFLTLILLTFSLFLPAFAEDADAARAPRKVLKAVGEIPVLFNGRVMPLDSFARLHLLQFSGRKSYQGESAISWMGRLLFVPESTEDDAVFLINHPEVLTAIGVENFQMLPGERKPSTRRFSYHHLMPGVMKLEEIARRAQAMQDADPEALKSKEYLVEREALRVYVNVLTYRALGQVFAFARPLEDLRLESPEIREALKVQLGEDTFSYLELGKRISGLAPLMIEAQAQEDPTQWTEAQQDAFTLAQMMFMFQQNLSELPLTMLPEAPHGESIWIAPMDGLSSPDGDQALVNAAERSGAMALAWAAGDWDEVANDAKMITEFSRSRMKHVRETGLTGKEAQFNRANYFVRAKVFYIFGFFIALAALLSGNRILRLAAWVPVSIALVLHLSGLAWRIYLTARPPVTNLYGTFLFVGLICLLLALLVESFQKNGLGLFAGSFVALTFLFIADRFAAEGDTMHKVVAVLASNFWLSTHVLAVTTGYAGVWFAGVFGHIWLVLKMLGKDKKTLETVRLPMEGLLGFGLTFAFLGTMLGGVWADQSWGRFWGWDPKENGALLIVLWTAVVYHARVAGLIRDVGTAVGTVVGCIMVMVAWLGVNLLGVGLHSYGFTTAMATGFYGFIGFELVFILICLTVILVQEKAVKAS